MCVPLLRRSEQLFRWDYTSEAAVHLDACALCPGTIMQGSWRRTQPLMPLQGKLNPTNDTCKKTLGDLSFTRSLLWPLSAVPLCQI